jgi:hypothetical protein
MVEILVNGRRGTKVVPLAEDRPLVIGRKGKLRIDDRQISRQHARVVRRDDAWYVEDLGSKNGTFINQVRVKRTERVEPGDTIRIGNTSMIVRQAPPPPPPPSGLPARAAAPRPTSLEIPDRNRSGESGLVLASATAGDVASRRWGPIVLIGMTLALIVSILFNAISYARTVSVLRGLELAAQQRAEQRDLELIAALRSDLRKPPAGYAELAATVELAARRNESDPTSESTDRLEQRFVQLHRSTSDELGELRRSLDALGKKLDVPPLPAQPPTIATASASKQRAVAEPTLTTIGASSTGMRATVEPPPDVVFLVDASRGLRAALPQALTQVRLARLELAARQSCRIFVAQESGVVEVHDDGLASSSAGDFSPVVDDMEPAGDTPSLTRAIAFALKFNPRTLHLFTDNAGKDGGELRDLLKVGAAGSTSVNVTHFYTREFREDLTALARDHGGMYSFIAQR